MIAKISATENLGGALGYNFKKVEKEEASILLAAELYQDREGRYTMEDVLADMQAVIPEKCRTKKMVFHCSLNPHPDEKLSDETLMQIAKEYMEALGYGKQPYIVFKHNGYLATCECSTGWVLVPNAVKEADEARKLKEMEDKYNIKEDEYGGVF